MTVMYDSIVLGGFDHSLSMSTLLVEGVFLWALMIFMCSMFYALFVGEWCRAPICSFAMSRFRQLSNYLAGFLTLCHVR